MPNSTGGQSCPALSLTPLPAPLPPVRYMSAWGLGCVTDTEAPLSSQTTSGNCVCFPKLKSHSMLCDVDAVWIWVNAQKHCFPLYFAQTVYDLFKANHEIAGGYSGTNRFLTREQQDALNFNPK